MPMPPHDAANRRSGRHKPDTDLVIETPLPLPPSPPRIRLRDRNGDRNGDRDRDRAARPQTPPDCPPPTFEIDSASSGGHSLLLSDGPATRTAADVETFLQGLAPVSIPIDMSSAEHGQHDHPEPRHRNQRDSHDLSLSPRQVTRDSLVANMLLSLDRLSLGRIDTFGASSRTPFDEPAPYPPIATDDARAMTFHSRPSRGAGHSYSYSSDLEGTEISSRGRRSNSSSGYQQGLGRINSMRETSQRSPGRALHSRGGKGSKNGSTSSTDAAGYVQVLGSQRWTRGFARRSSSFDGEPRPSANPWHVEFSSSFFNDGYDAAPTPNIPGGPRKLTTAPSLPVLPPPEPKTEPKSPAKSAVVERRRSTRSSRSATVGRKSESKFNPARDAPPLPVLDLDSAPAPHVGYEKTKDSSLVPPTPAAPQAKEKHGFFRRMFSSSKSVISGSSSSPQVSSSAELPMSRSPFASQPKSSAPPSRESHHSTTHTLQKKTSSFFRRRKYSITDTELPPVPNIPAAPAAKLPLGRLETAPAVKPEPSPITSLRRAMDPFLQGSPASTAVPTPVDTVLPSIEAPQDSPHPDTAARRDGDETTRTTRGFSPDYEPSPKAVIRKVESEPANEAGAAPLATPTRQAPEDLAESPPKSFLRDNSDSEDSPVQHRKVPRSDARDKSLRPTPEPDRIARSPSPVVSKSKSVPNLTKAARQDSKRPAPSRTESAGLGSETMYKPSLPSLRIDSAEPSPDDMGMGELGSHSGKSIDEPEVVVGEPTKDDRQKAQKIFEGIEDFIQKDRAAAWMGEEGIVRQRTLRAYMELYDFENQSIVASLRQVCQRLLLRAETQQVDRILVAFAKRWCDCNPNHGFKTPDVIHTICYSIILLNTDLHVADIEHRMTRSQFIKNTMTTIRQTLQESAPEAFERPSILPSKGNLGLESDPRSSEEHNKHNSFRASFKPPPRPGSTLGIISDQPAADSCGPLVKAPFDGSLRAWESQVEIVLKDIYASIRDDRLPLFGAEASPLHTPSGLSVMGMLKRSPSVLSKAPSESVASTRGRIPEAVKANSSRFNSKSRSRPRGFGTGFSSSRTSFEDGNSVWSPTDSSATWSKVSLGRTHTSMSMDSFGSSYPRGDFKQSIGFANALSQAIIREDSALEVPKDEVKCEQLLDDESLELAGPPWVKEGIVTHKHHLDGIDKKAKDRNWTEVFAVIQKGQLSLFSFSPNKSLRNKHRRGGLGNGGTLPKGAVVGGGNWQDNATNLGTFSLRQTLASTLPPPGYSRSRPHVWALSLPTGAVHLFQVGTADISKEFVSTANYWSARLSTHPLVGGISNIEYGWSDAIINNALVNAIHESAAASAPAPTRPGSGSISISHMKSHSRSGSAANAAAGIIGGRSSMQSGRSMRSASFDFVRPGSGSSGVLGLSSSLPRHPTTGSNPPPSSSSAHHHHHIGKLPGDRIHITDWSPPASSMRPSNLPEREQLESLLAYVRSIEAELQAHNALRSPMLLAFSPRSANAAKAMANWERKSEYLLREIVKFRTYVDCLQQAEVRRVEIYRERETARRAARGDAVSDEEGEGERQVEGLDVRDLDGLVRGSGGQGEEEIEDEVGGHVGDHGEGRGGS